MKLDNYMIVLVTLGGLLGSVVLGVSSLGDQITLHLEKAIKADSATAASYPLVIDHQFKLKERSGDAKDVPASLVVFENTVIDPDQSCEFCNLVRYSPARQGFAGVAYTTEQPLDLTKAKRLTVLLMGEDGGEKVKLGIAGKKDKEGGQAKYALKSKDIVLSNDWMPIQIDVTKVTNKDTLLGVTNPFEIQILSAKPGTNAVYFKYVTFDLEAAENPIESIAEASAIHSSEED